MVLRKIIALGVFTVACSALLVPLPTAHAQQYNEKTPGYKAAVDAFRSASILVLGRDINLTEKQVATGSGTFGYSGVKANGWTAFFTTNDMVQLFAEYDAAAKPGKKIADGIGFPDAAKFLKARLQTQSATSNKMILILLEQSFTETLGRVSTPVEQAAWTAKIRDKGLVYAPIKLSLMQVAKDDKKEREGMINRTYLYAFGRIPTASEKGYWMPKGEYFDQIVAASRTFLVKGAGSVEYPEVVRRALKATGKDGGDASVKKAMGVFGAGKGMVYAEMFAYLDAMKNGTGTISEAM